MPGYGGNSPSQIEKHLAKTYPGLFGFLKDSATLRRELNSVWRVTYSIYALQTLGAILGYFFSHVPIVFGRLWWGAIQGGMIGYLLGLAWEFSNKERRNRLHLGVIVYVGVIAVILFVAGLFIPWERLSAASHSTQGP